MVSELLSTQGEDVNTTSSPKTYTDVFNELFPYYLSIGMSEEQFWDRDCLLVIAYRKADELRTKRRNSEMWIQGAYVYEALLRISPILHDFAKKGTKPVPYVEEPFALSKEQSVHKEKQKEKKVFNKGKSFMQAFMTRFNKKFEGE